MSSARTKRLYGRAIKILCSRPGYSQRGLAEHLGVDDSYVSKICAGSKYPESYLDEIVEYLNVAPYVTLKENPLSDEPERAPVMQKKPVDPKDALTLLADIAGYDIKIRKKRTTKSSVKKN